MSDATKAVFLSYASQDAEAARRIADALRGFGVEVWFDQSELRGGDAWDQKIRTQIKDCTLFLPVISAHTEARGEGYFRLEWKLADERTNLIAKGVPFVVPVVIDTVADGDAMVPDSFRAVQWTRLADGSPTPEFVAQVKRLLEAPRKSGGVKKNESIAPATSAALPAAKPGFPAGIVAALVVIVIGLVAFIALRPSAKMTPAAPVKPVAETNPAPAPPPAAAVSDKSIAVLPFENMSEDKDANAFFADGIHETILTNLAHIRELRVVSRTSVMDYRDTKKKIPQIARELGVAYVLEGSVQRSGKKVRVTGQLIRAATDEHLWADDYTKDLTAADIFDIESELAQKIATSLQAALSPQEKILLVQRPTENLEAYDLYLKARADRRDSVGAATPRLQREEALTQAAVTLDPKFAAAWGELGIVHADTYFFGYDRTATRLAKARVAIENAARLAPEDPDVIRAGAEYFFHGMRDYSRAAAEYERLIRLQPNDPNMYSGLAYVQRRQGRFADSVANFRKALQLDPGDYRVTGNLVDTLTTIRRYDDAIELQRRMVAMRSDGVTERYNLARLAFLAHGSTSEVETFLEGLSEAQANSSAGKLARSDWALTKGDYIEAIRLAEGRISITALTVGRIAIAMAISSDPSVRALVEKLAAEFRAQIEREPENDRVCATLGLLEAALGNHDAARRYAAKVASLVPETLDALNGPVYSITSAVAFAWAGDKERAITDVTHLLRVPCYGINVFLLKHDPRFIPLQGDPRWEALLNDPKNNAPLF